MPDLTPTPAWCAKAPNGELKPLVAGPSEDHVWACLLYEIGEYYLEEARRLGWDVVRVVITEVGDV
jgi:hypothetical protein